MVRSGELLFVKSVKDGIPNRDPLNDSDARRIFDEEDGRISLSDVSIKRDVRDYVLAKHGADGGAGHRYFVFVRQERTEDGKLLGRRGLARAIQDRVGKADEPMEEVLTQHAFDVRTFGAVYSVGQASFHLTGPVQFGWAHSLHPVETKYVQGTVVMPSEEAESGGKGQGTVWTTYVTPFAVFVMPGIINATLASETGMTDADAELLLEALWNGTRHRQARGRGIQQALLLLHVEYKDPFFRIGYLEEALRIEPGRDGWLSPRRPTSLSEISLNVEELAGLLDRHRERIERARVWTQDGLRLTGSLPSWVRPQPAW